MSRVIDGGGFEGDWSRQILQRFECTVEIYEPLPAFAEPLRHDFSNDPRVTIVEAALWNTNTSLEMSPSADSSSLLNANTSGSIVSVRAIDSAECLATPAELLKLNIEGAEFEVLERLISTGAVQNAKFLQVQFHDFADDAYERREAIRNALRATHDCEWCIPWIWESWARKGS
jgi:FkbM family methyltransferase